MPDTTRFVPAEQTDIANEQVAKVATIKAVSLVSVQAKQKEAEPGTEGGSFGTEGVRFRTAKTDQGTMLWVRPNFVGKGAARKVSGELSGFEITAEFELIYHFRHSEWVTQESISHFAGINGVFNCWPFWRELVGSTLGRMGLPGVVVPLFLVHGKQ